MNEPVEIIQSILLVTLMVILAAILYKKLLRKLGDDPSKPKFMNIESAVYDKERGMLILTMDAPEPTELEVFISGPGFDRKHLIKRSLEEGGRVEEMSVGDLTAGKFELEVLTGQQRITTYLNVD
jgi:hypothetical protein